MTDFWRGRSVLVTGHTGFKGGWLCLWLSRLGASVTGLALPPETDPNLYEAARVGETLTSITADVRDLSAVSAAFARTKPSVVFHLAAQSLVRASYQDPVGTYATNVMGTAHVLEAARHTPGVAAVVVVTSDKCYENREWCWGYREYEPLGGRDPYSSSKGCAELVTAAYRRSFFEKHGPAVASARAGNVIGGGDWAADRLVPDIMRALAAGKPAPIRNPSSIRPWQHVLEPLAGYLRLAEALCAGNPQAAAAFNFGPAEEEAVPVAELADRLCALWGDGAGWQNLAEQDAPHEAHYLKLDSSRARTDLGWVRRLDLSAALSWTADWYRAHARGENMQAATLGQIDQYAALSGRA
ncbi:MAG: CDP-glucose 4,6-dehydratase [Deltaproteobacteria bacterium]|nr:CDP-glucose 4,6-dehydratase [Deltaproteobacteria bacterium]